MGSLILCHKQHAKRPYEITRIHRRIYNIEELCYYFCNNLYLIDYTIMNEQLCEWIEQELQMGKLSAALRDSLENYHSIEHFVMLVLTESDIYTAGELARIKSVLERLNNQNEIERKKFKADNLLKSREYQLAILVYHEILNEEKNEKLDGKFYGQVYACLGAAYGGLFLYEEAARMYEAAFQICEDEAMLKAYLYACYCYMSSEEYKILISKSEIYARLDYLMQERIQEIREEISVRPSEELLDIWKEEYRRS